VLSCGEGDGGQSTTAGVCGRQSAPEPVRRGERRRRKQHGGDGEERRGSEMEDDGRKSSRARHKVHLGFRQTTCSACTLLIRVLCTSNTGASISHTHAL
jgi:hypothetical protein